nr:glycoside hydrolase family 16 protein [uncultured Lichenicoccus sp.]
MKFSIALIAAIAGLAAGSAAQAQDVAAATAIDTSYRLVLDDEFNGNAVDTSKWNVMANSWIGGGYGLDQFTPSNATVANGALQLLTSKGSPSGRPYSAAFMSTRQSFQYGYFEERAMMPANGHGTWPAFWMNNNGNYPEIDIFEWLGNNASQQWSTYHPSNDAALTNGVGLGTVASGPDLSNAFHVYGMLWTPTSITWFIDGVQTFQLFQGEVYKGVVVKIPSTPMQTILNSAVGGWNGNNVDSTTVFPNAYLIDYIHIYSNSPNAVAVAPQANYSGPSNIFGPMCTLPTSPLRPLTP